MTAKNIVILDGNPDPVNIVFDLAVAELDTDLGGRGHAVTRFTLRDMNLKQCVGCWSCWVRTPGRCAVDDDGDDIRRAWRHADVVVLASPLVMGFISSELKTITDKFIPLAHPYITLVDGECMHQHRYDRLPALAALLQTTPDDTDEDLRVNVEWIRRTAEHAREPVVATIVVERGRGPNPRTPRTTGAGAAARGRRHSRRQTPRGDQRLTARPREQHPAADGELPDRVR